jgi:hypothetical protein
MKKLSATAINGAKRQNVAKRWWFFFLSVVAGVAVASM